MDKAVFVLFPEALEQIYPPSIRTRIAELVHLTHPPQTRESVTENPSLLADLEILISGWGAPVLDEPLLNAAPKLRAVFFGAGSIRSVVTPPPSGSGISRSPPRWRPIRNRLPNMWWG